MKENKQKERDEDWGNDRQKGYTATATEAEITAEYHSCGEQADSAQQSKHTAGLLREGANGGGATSLSLLVPPTILASLRADSCTPVIYFSPPHLAGRLLPITQSRGSTLTARHPARAMASWCDTLCCWTLPTGDPLKSVCHFNFHYCCSFGRFPSQSSGWLL